MSTDRFIGREEELQKFSVEKILIAGNRGPCAGVNMALEAANQVLTIVDGREIVWTNWPVVNNKPIMEELTQRGLKSFDNDWSLVPDGSIVLFSAHGVTPEHRRIAALKNCLAIDTTCLLVEKVHNLVKEAEVDGLHVVYIGKKGHPETEGVMSEVSKENISLIENEKDVSSLEIGTGDNCILYSQTTLMPDEVDVIEVKLATAFPDLEIPDKLGICYATHSRQKAVEGLVKSGIDLLVVVGSKNSHNSQMLMRKGEREKIASYSVDYPYELKDTWFNGVKVAGITSGASVLDKFMDPIVESIIKRSKNPKIEYQEQVKKEPMNAMYPLPKSEINRLMSRYTS